MSSSLTLTALAVSRCARSRSADRRRRVVRGQSANEEDHPRHGRHAERMTPDEAGRTVADRIRPRADRFVTQVAPEIVGEGGHRRVTLGGVLLERLGDDRVEVAAQGSLETVGVVPQCAACAAGSSPRSDGATAASESRPGSVSTIARINVAGERTARPAG